MKETLNSTSPDSTVKKFGRIDYIKITILGFALTGLWQGMHSIILPIRLQDFVTESQKNTYLGLITFVGLLLAMAVQPIAGAISDRSGFRWGRRRPFIFIGIVAALVFLPGFGYAGSIAAIFAFYCLLQMSTNIAQGPFQAFIPEMVPENKRGMASGIKGLLEILGGMALLYPISIFMDRYFSGDGSRWLWLVLGLLGIVLLAIMLITILSVKEKRPPATTRIPLTATLRQIFKIDFKANPNFIWFLVSRLLVFMAFTTIQQFILNYFTDVIGVTNPADATFTFSIAAVAGMLVIVYPAGLLSDRFGRKSISITAGLLGGVGVLVMFSSPEYITIIMGAAILGVAIGAFNSTNWALATDLVPRHEEARYLGFANMATAGGAALARLIGPIIDFFNNFSPGMGYQVMMLTSFTYFAVGALLLFKIKHQHQ